jgi:uncharacterized protein (TIGR02147 family)
MFGLDNNNQVRPLVFDFQSFSKFLASYMTFRKSMRPSFSYRLLGRMAGIRSQSLVAMIALGQRLPSNEALEKLMRALDFSDREAEFARLLVARDRAKDDHLKSYYSQRLRQIEQEQLSRSTAPTIPVQPNSFAG